MRPGYRFQNRSAAVHGYIITHRLDFHQNSSSKSQTIAAAISLCFELFQSVADVCSRCYQSRLWGGDAVLRWYFSPMRENGMEYGHSSAGSLGRFVADTYVLFSRLLNVAAAET